jgi:hypothetical protein
MLLGDLLDCGRYRANLIFNRLVTTLRRETLCVQGTFRVQSSARSLLCTATQAYLSGDAAGQEAELTGRHSAS